MFLNEKLFELCEKFNGVKEVGINQGFENKEFERMMLNAGWYRGAPWCSFAMRAIFLELGLEYKYISGSAWRTALNGSLRGYEWTTVPKPGSLIIWRRFKDGKPLSSGHIGLVHEVNKNTVVTYEGNNDTTDPDKIQEFGKHKRSITGDKWRVNDGLRLMGFLYPPHLD